jgi:hypothetical protein
LDDDCSFRTELATIKQQLKKLRTKASLTSRLLTNRKYVVFKTLIESIQLHKLVVIASHYPRAKDTLKTVYYSLIKELLGFKANVNKDLLLSLTIGDVEEYL